jgi:hypothetical protein
MILTFNAEYLTFAASTPGRNRAALKYRKEQREFTGLVLMEDNQKFAVCCRLKVWKGNPVMEVTLTDWSKVRKI